MKSFFITLSFNLFPLCLGIGSLYLAYIKNGSWGWFLISAVLSYLSYISYQGGKEK